MVLRMTPPAKQSNSAAHLAANARLSSAAITDPNDGLNDGRRIDLGDNPDDAAVMRALCQGHPAALEALYDRYGGLVYKLALRMLSQPEAAADLTQEVFLSLWKQPDRYQPSRGSLAVFLGVVTRSQALNRLRQFKSQQRLSQRFGQEVLPTHYQRPGLDRLSLEELADRVRQALQTIPEAQRQILELAYYEGLSQSDITAKTGIPLGTVKSRSRQGLLKLQHILEDLAE
jgi:RNA polymerase sigma-70 factor, ECF subfamily